jgi:hypothetical protein
MAPMRVIPGIAARRRQSAIEAAYDHFRVDRQGNLVSASTLDHYHYLVGPFFDWLRQTHPQVERFEDLDVTIIRGYRLDLARRRSERTGRPYEPATILDAHRLLITFLRWAAAEEYAVDPRILKLKAPKVPSNEYSGGRCQPIMTAADAACAGTGSVSGRSRGTRSSSAAMDLLSPSRRNGGAMAISSMCCAMWALIR